MSDIPKKGNYALMTLHFHSPKHRKFIFILLVIISLSFSLAVFGKRRAASGSRHARAQKGRKASARTHRGGRQRGRVSARNSRRGRRGARLSARDIRRQRALIAREQSSSLKALERRLHRPLTKRERAAEMRRIEGRHRRDLEVARRRAEAARQAAIARQRAIDQAMRAEVQSFIAKDDTSGEDPEVRRVALNALGNHAGTVVVMDPVTGRVYSVVNQEWALRRGFKPCSTIKLVTGVAGLTEKIIPPVETAGDGYRLDLTSALAHSNNPYFEQVGSHLGFDKMVSYARELGLGEKTGLNVPFEFAGHLPEQKPGFIERRMFSYADGFEVTPMQLSTLVSALANGGRLLAPQIVPPGTDANKFSVKVRRKLDFGSDVFQRMIPGMVGSVNYGSGRRAYDPAQTVAGKTGTCIGQGGWVGLFTSYAPLVSPRLAIVVIAQGADARNHFPAAVAGEIYRELNHRFGTPTNMQVAATMDDEEKENADKEAADNGETEENADGTENNQAATASSTPQPVAPSSAKPAGSDNAVPRSTVKRVLMPIEKKPVAPQTTTGSLPAGTKEPLSNGPSSVVSPSEQRPRRTHPDQP